MTNVYFAYTRVSTTKQSTEGTSLEEQRRAIIQYATSRQLHIDRWFEEVKSASKGKRVIFRELMSLLKKQQATGTLSTRSIVEH